MNSMVVVGSGSQLHSVFVYGSLLADEVVAAVLNRIPSSSAAVLHGFHRFSIKGRVYPAILPVHSKQVTGKVLLGITDPELYILDEFEDVEYERSSVQVSLMESSEKLQADTYVWSNKNDPNLFGEWDFEEWRKYHIDDFVEMTRRFVAEMARPESKPRVATYESYYQQDGNAPPMS